MSSPRPRIHRSRSARLGAGLLGGVLIALVLGLPALAAVGPTKLENASVSPTTGTTDTLVTFQVSYRNVKGTAPVYVRVRVGSTTTYPMTGSGTDWKAGVVFTVSTRLPEGSQAVTFEALDSEKFPDSLPFGTVDIGPGTPTPPPTAPPSPTGAPTPTPTSRPAATPTSQPGASAPTAPSATRAPGDASPAPSDAATGGGTTLTTGGTDGTGGAGTGSVGGSTGLVAPTYAHDTWATDSTTGAYGSPVGGGATDSTTGDRGDGVDRGVSGAGGVATGRIGDGGTTSGKARATGLAAASDATRAAFAALFTSGGAFRRTGSWLGGPLAAGFAAVGWDAHRPSLLIGLVGAFTGVAIGMAFALFGKRRRDEELPAPPAVLAANAAQAVAATAVAPMLEPVDPESLMPRWRRPSLLEARRTDPLRAPAVVRPHLSFGATVNQPAGSERRLIRYAVAPLLDRPDEILGLRLGDLSTGDEVELVERSGAYWLVTSPDGRQGWLHRMTLGEVVGASRTLFDGAEETSDGQDVLAALLAARGIPDTGHSFG